jgi:predicted RNase H-like HicB family nuclease
MLRAFTGVFEKVDDWYIAYVEELPGANTQARTLDEARENLREAIELVLAANREIAGGGVQAGNVIREEIRVEVQ